MREISLRSHSRPMLRISNNSDPRVPSPLITYYSHIWCILFGSAGCGPDEEALLPNVEVDIAADLVGHVGAEVATDDAVPHTLVLLLK